MNTGGEQLQLNLLDQELVGRPQGVLPQALTTTLVGKVYFYRLFVARFPSSKQGCVNDFSLTFVPGPESL